MASRQGIDIAGQRFGKLVAIEPAYSCDNGQGVRWRLKCDCGNYHDARANVLRLGNVKSCGCMKSAKGRKNDHRSLIGKRFGNVSVVNLVGNIGDGNKRHWECVCDCGVRFNARGTDLKAGNTKSCGCLRFKN